MGKKNKGRALAGSPFSVVTTASGRAAAQTLGLHGATSQRRARQDARYFRDARFSCDATTGETWDGPNGEVEVAAHGFAFAKVTGAPCPGSDCTGKVR